jgi:hypothetical protein
MIQHDGTDTQESAPSDTKNEEEQDDQDRR